MHYQLSALGRIIVCEERIPGKRSRLWDHEEALSVLKRRMGTERVEALSLCFELESTNRHCFTRKEFKKLKYLWYLQVDGTDLAGDFEDVLFHLRWLNWRGCSPYFQLTNFCLENLVILDLSNSCITEDWGGWSHFKVAKKLKVLQLANCGLRRTLDFSSYEILERLILRSCESLMEIHLSIGSMKNLKVLDISYADIRTLPAEIWMLEKLEVMDFTKSGNLRGDIPSYMGKLSSLRFLSFCDTKIQSLPRSLRNLCCLQTLNLGGCTYLQSLPELPSSLRVLHVASIPNLTNLVNLQELHFVGGCEYAEIPRDIGNLSKLEKLTLDSTNIRILPKEIGVLSHLKLLNVQFCDDLQYIVGLPSSLVDLSLAYCDSLERLPYLSYLKSLSKLLLHNCESLTKVQGLGRLESLTNLNINACDMLANLGDMSNLSKLIALCITNCRGLMRIQGLAELEFLRCVDLHGCENLYHIEGLKDLGSLEVFDVLGCPLETIQNLPNMPIQRC
ncbi:disease resistance protein RUN1-like [Cornus florida]|uniref:disease resistance protein RUN1-like n=1 Tax=Cornus florida TaxID=4283 RepID=UPI00289C50FA|nr:disease resistance protein RUN1-like [Cornus florida]